LREASTAEARQKYNTRRDYYDSLIQENPSIGVKRYYRNLWKQEQTFFKNSYPLLARQLEMNEGYKSLKTEALNDLRKVVDNGLAPNKELGTLFKSMIMQYDNAQAQISGIQGSTNRADAYKKLIKSDLKDFLRTLAGSDPNAISLYWNIFEPLIGD
jgi:hypothetical protein